VSEHFEIWYVFFLYLPYAIMNRTTRRFWECSCLGDENKTCSKCLWIKKQIETILQSPLIVHNSWDFRNFEVSIPFLSNFLLRLTRF